MDDILQSNIVIKSRVARPNREGVRVLLSDFDKIEKRLQGLTKTPWVIKLQIDDSDLVRYNLQARVQKLSSGKGGGGGGGAGGAGFAGGLPGGVLSRRVTVAGDNVTTQERRQKVTQQQLVTETQITDLEGEKNKFIREELALKEKVLINDKKRRAEATELRLLQQRQSRLAAEGRELGVSVRRDIQSGQFPLTLESDKKGFLFERIAASEREALARRQYALKQFATDRIDAQRHLNSELSKLDREQTTAANKEQRARNRQETRLARHHVGEALTRIDTEKKEQAKQERRAARFYASESISQLENERKARDKQERQLGRHHLNTTLKQQEDERRAVQRNENRLARFHLQQAREEREARDKQERQIAREHRRRTLAEADKETSERIKQDRRAARAHVIESQAESRRRGVGDAVNSALVSGFQEGAETRYFDALTNKMTTIRTLTRTTGNAFTGYRVEILRANEATGKLTSELLTGSRAMRYLGDSAINAIAKVSLWTFATTAIFGAVAAIGHASEKIRELEENTVLLARVGRSFAGGSNDYEDRLIAAEKLTEQIIDLTTVYGGSADEAQRAASVFARAGQDEVDTLHSVRAALLASRIAELEVEDSAKLLSAALLQFGLRGRDLLPVLDSLNTLSNNYRVSTDDLLQSISRTGAVFAEHNGRLSQLAALTAIVSQTTARTGSEIGNAFKTISSNLDRLDIQLALFEKLGVSTVNFAGESKSLGQILLELQTRMDRLSVTEQKQLTLLIAGVRQRNILLASIHGATDAIVAENEALLKGGSAQEEFAQRSGTMRSALERIYATLIKLANFGGSGFNRFAADLINVLDTILRFISAFDGIFIKAGAAALGFLLIERAIRALGVQLLALYTATARQIALQQAANATNLASAVSHLNNARAVGVHAVALRGLATAGAAAGSLLGTIFSPTGLVTIGLISAITLMGSAAEKNNTYAESIQTATLQIQENITSEDRRQLAIRNSVNAIAELILQYNKLRVAGQSGSEVRQRGERIAESAGFSLSSGNFDIANLLTQAGKAEGFSLDTQRGNLQKLIQLQEIETKKQIDQLIQLQFNRDNAAYSLFSGTDPFKRAFDRSPFGDFSSSSQKKIIADYDREILQLELAINKATDEQVANQQRLNNLKQQQFKLDSLQSNRDTLQRLVENRQRFQERGIENEARDFTSTIDPTQSFKLLSESLTKVGEDYRRAHDTLETALKQGFDPNLLEENFKELEKLRTEYVKTFRDANQNEIENIRKGFGTLLGSRSELTAGAGSILLERTRRLTDASSFGDQVAGIDLQRQQQLDRIANAQRAIEASRGGSAAGRAGVTAAAREEQQAAVTRLKELEAEKALAILEAEKNIAIERKKSADEAARALGALSDEDKLRVRAQAAFFAADPKRKFSLEEQFLSDSNSSRILQQFFPGRGESLSSAKGSLAATLKAGGLGITEDLAKGEAELAAARGGRTDAQLLQDAITGIARLTETLERQQGRGGVNLLGFAQGPLGFGGGQAGVAGGRIDNTLSVDVKGNTLNIEPLIAGFEKVVIARNNEAIAELAKRNEQFLREFQALNLKRPKIAIQQP